MTPAIRIAFVSEHYPPTDGGVATSTQRVARALSELGAVVTVYCFDHSRPVDSPDYVVAEEDAGVHVRRVGPFFLKQAAEPADRVSERIKATLRRRIVGQLTRFLEETKCDLVLSFYLLNAGFIAQFVARAHRLPCIVGVRGNDIGRNIFNVERFGVVQWVVAGADRVVCVNEHLKSRLLLAFPDASSKSSVISNSVPNPKVDPSYKTVARRKLLEKYGWNAEDLIAVFIGNLREKKGVEPLLRAFELLPDNHRIRLLVIGPEPGAWERRLLGDAWSRLNTSNRCRATGILPRAEVAEVAIGGDIALMPSLDDGLANGLLEGMALGLCPIATTIFGEVIVNGRSGLLVPPGDSASLAKVLQECSTAPHRVASLGNAARVAASQWTPSHEAGAYLELFRQTLASYGVKR